MTGEPVAPKLSGLHRSSLRLVLGGALALMAACVGEDPNSTFTDVPDASTSSSSSGDGGSSSSSGGEAGTPAPPPPAVQDKTSWTYFARTRSTAGGARVAATPDGGAIVTASYVNPPDSSGLPAGDPSGVYVVRLDASGKPTWQKGLLLAEKLTYPAEPISGVVCDDAGDIYLAGMTPSALTVDGTTTIAAKQLYLLKLSGADGHPLWAKTITAPAYSSIDVDVRGGRLAVSGNFSGTLEYDGHTLTAGSSQCVYVARLSAADGKADWIHAPATDKLMSAGGVTIDADGLVYVSASHHGDLRGAWGEIAYTSGDAQGLILGFDDAGKPRWAKSIVNPSSTTLILSQIRVNAGIVAVRGIIPPNIALGEGPKLGVQGNVDPFVAAFDAGTGALRWGLTIGNDLIGGLKTSEAINGVDVDAWGQVIAVGEYRDKLTVGTKVMPAPPADTTAAYGVKIDGAGSVVWTKSLVATNGIRLQAARATPAGSFVAAGNFRGRTDLGDGQARDETQDADDLGVVDWTP